MDNVNAEDSEGIFGTCQMVWVGGSGIQKGLFIDDSSDNTS